jgi:hypothetical protein
MISDFDDLEHEFGMLRSMVEVSGRPMSISLAQGLSPHGWRKVLGLIEQASADGLVMRGQVAPRPIGILLGLTTTLNPFITRPSYMEVAGLPLAERLRALADPARKARILAEAPSPGFQRLFKLMADGRKLWLLGDPPNYEPAPEDSIAARAAASGRDAWDLAYDLMLEHGGKVIFYTPFANYAENNLDCCRDMLLHKDTVPGLGDGGAHVGTICDASFVTTLLDSLGPRPHPRRAHRPRHPGEAADPRHRPGRRPARPRRAGPRHEGRPERHRLRAPAEPGARDRARPAGRRRAARAEGRRLRGHGGQRRGHLRERRADRRAARAADPPLTGG